MIHGLLLGQGGSASASGISFTPPAGSYSGTSETVLVSASNATKVQYKIDDTGWITAPSSFVDVIVYLTYTGKTLYANALDSSGAIIASDSATYFKA